MPENKRSLKILVIGPTGHGGSYLCIELCQRGHHVTGLSRNPSTIGPHENYKPKVFDISAATFTELHEALEGYDVVIKFSLGNFTYDQ
jgi:putative NADH-flavin reductase